MDMNQSNHPSRSIVVVSLTWQARLLVKQDTQWNRQHQQLVEFQRINGHCMVPYNYQPNKSLGYWVSRQRIAHKNNKLRLDRKDLLNQIGFASKDDSYQTVKQSDDKRWHQQYEKLLHFKRLKGHCQVPRIYQQDKSLGVWVMNQRLRHANHKLLRDRKELLDDIGFVWKADNSFATRASSATNNSDSEAFTSSVGRPNEALKETDEAQGHVKNRSECPSPKRKRPNTSLIESGQMAATRADQRGEATGSSSYVEEDGGGRDEEESKPSPVTSGSYPGQEVVPEQATTLGEIPYGWTRVKLEPDC